MSEEKYHQSFNLDSELFLVKDLGVQIKAEKNIISKESEILKSLQKQKGEKLESIQDKIISGEWTTGDKFKDFAIVFFEASEEKENQLHELENQLGEHKGEFVLLKDIRCLPHGHIDFGQESRKLHPELYHWEKKVRVGVINERVPLVLDINIGNIIIAPEKYSSLEDRQVISYDYPLSIIWSKFNKIGQSVESFYSSLISSPTVEQIKSKGVKDLALEILIGDKEVFKYFKNQSIPDLYQLVAKQLGRELKKVPPESEKALLERKKEVFEELQELIKQEKETRSKNESHKTEKEQFLFGINEVTIRDIKSKLEKAFDLGMHKDPLIIIEEPEPGKKIEFNVPQFISNCCEIYHFVNLKKRLSEETEKLPKLDF